MRPYIPGPIVIAALPPRSTEPSGAPAVGGANAASGSGIAAAPVLGWGLRLALTAELTPPTTWMLWAVTRAPPPAETAVAELESTTTAPGMVIAALPESVSAPLAVGSRTKIEGATVTV